MAEAHSRKIVFPNKQSENFEKFYRAHLLESETYTGGKVEFLISGIFRADFPTDFTLSPKAIQSLIDSLDEIIEFSAKHEASHQKEIDCDKIITLFVFVPKLISPVLEYSSHNRLGVCQRKKCEFVFSDTEFLKVTSFCFPIAFWVSFFPKGDLPQKQTQWRNQFVGTEHRAELSDWGPWSLRLADGFVRPWICDNCQSQLFSEILLWRIKVKIMINVFLFLSSSFMSDKVIKSFCSLWKWKIYLYFGRWKNYSSFTLDNSIGPEIAYNENSNQWRLKPENFYNSLTNIFKEGFQRKAAIDNCHKSTASQIRPRAEVTKDPNHSVPPDALFPQTDFSTVSAFVGDRLLGRNSLRKRSESRN